MRPSKRLKSAASEDTENLVDSDNSFPLRNSDDSRAEKKSQPSDLYLDTVGIIIEICTMRFLLMPER